MRNANFEMRNAGIEFRISHCEFRISFGVDKAKKRRIDNGVVADPRCGSVRVLLLRLLALGRRMLVCDSLVVLVMTARLVGSAASHSSASRCRLSCRSRLRRGSRLRL